MTEKESLVYDEQVALLYSNLPIGAFASILNSIIITILFWNLLSHAILLLWCLSVISATFIRLIVMIVYRKSAARHSSVVIWSSIMIAGLGCTGILWGMTAAFMFFIDSLSHKLVIAFVTGGMVAGASATYSARRAAYYAFSVPALIPVIVIFFILKGTLFIGMGVMTLLFFILLSFVAEKMHGLVKQSYMLKYDKDELIENLEKSRKQTEAVNTDLRQEVVNRQMVEEDLRQLSVNLEKQVIQRTEELEFSNRELAAFTASASHDLQAPLRIIDNFGRLLESEYCNNFDATGKHYVMTIRDSIKRMRDLINDLMVLSGVTQQDIKIQAVDLSKLAQEISTILKNREPSRNVEFIIEESGIVYGDLGLLRIVMENLLGNAWKFTSKKSPAHIKFGVNKDGAGKTFYVSDDGAGFPMKSADKLFTAFNRLHSQNEFEGTGIGLATVARIIKRHNGSIRAEGEEEKGAVFYFTLPQ